MLKHRFVGLGLIGLFCCVVHSRAEDRTSWDINQSSATCRDKNNIVKMTLRIDPCIAGEGKACNQLVTSNGTALSVVVESDTTTLNFFGAECETIASLVYPGQIPSTLGVNTKHGVAYAFLTNFPKAQETVQGASDSDDSGCDDGPAISSTFVMWSLIGNEQLRLGPYDFRGEPPTITPLDERYAWYPAASEGQWSGDQFVDFQTSKSHLATYSPPVGTSGMTGAGTVARGIKQGGLIEISAVTEYIKPTGRRVSLKEFNDVVLSGYPDWLELLQSLKPVRTSIYEGHLP
jgi:hypothetical protein